MAVADLGRTLMHEHVFVRDPELEVNMVGLEWQRSAAIERAVVGLTELHRLGFATIVDVTVIGLGRDVSLVREAAARSPVNIVAATGAYLWNGLPLYFAAHGPGRLVDMPEEPLADLFIRDIEEGIADTSVRAGIIKVTTSGEVMSDDEGRVLSAAASAHGSTGVPITTHSEPSHRNGLAQQQYLIQRGVPPASIIIGHSGDSDDLDYLRRIMDGGSTIGLDRFGMEHVLADEARIDTLVSLAALGYCDRMVLSHDAAFYSHVTPPSWRSAHAPKWHMAHLSDHILPALRDRGVAEADIDQMLISNPARLLAREPDR